MLIKNGFWNAKKILIKIEGDEATEGDGNESERDRENWTEINNIFDYMCENICVLQVKNIVYVVNIIYFHLLQSTALLIELFLIF